MLSKHSLLSIVPAAPGLIAALRLIVALGLNVALGLIAALSLIAAPVAMAQAYPAKAVKIVVPFPPGGPTDIVGRFVAAKLSESMGQQFVVENRAGAGGTVGSEAASQAGADAYTLFYGSSSTLAMAPSLYRKRA